MSIEAWALKEAEKKKKKIDETLKKEEEKKVLEWEKMKGEIREHIKTEEALSKLHELLDNHELDFSESEMKIMKKATEDADLSHEDIEEILEKIDEIESTQDVDKYLPKENRITKDEYKKALHDEVFRVQMITKIDLALAILANQVNPSSWIWINLFSGYLALLDKKLIKIQENHIDIKDNLKKLDSDINEKKLSWWQRFLKFIQEIFN